MSTSRTTTLTAILATLALALSFLALSVSTAKADPLTPLSGGMKVTSNGTNFCSLGAVGYDRDGVMVAMIAGHCMHGVGAPLYLCDDQTQSFFGPTCGLPPEGQRNQLGTYVTAPTGYDHVKGEVTNWSYDYAVIELDPSKVRLESTTPNGLQINGIGDPQQWQTACKDGKRTGKTCGAILSIQDNQISTWGHAWFGDSGSPLVVGDKLVGFTSTINANPFGPFAYVGIQGALQDMAARDVVGAGFTPAGS